MTFTTAQTMTAMTATVRTMMASSFMPRMMDLHSLVPV